MKPGIKARIWNIKKQKTTKELKKKENSVRRLWDDFKHSNVCIIGVPGEEKEQEIRNLFEK